MANPEQAPQVETSVDKNPLIETSERAVAELRSVFPDARLTMLFNGPNNTGIRMDSDFTSKPKDELIFMASTVKPLIAAAVLQSLGGEPGEEIDMNMPILMRWMKEDGGEMNKFSGEEQIWVDLLNKGIQDAQTKFTVESLPAQVTLQQTLDAVLGNSVNGAIGGWYQHLKSKGIENPQDVVQAYVNKLINGQGLININGSSQSGENGLANVATPQTLFEVYRKLLSNDVGLNVSAHDAIVRGIQSAVGSQDLELSGLFSELITQKEIKVIEKAGWYYNFITTDDPLAKDNGIDSAKHTHMASFNLLARLKDAAGKVRDVGIMVSIPYSPQEGEVDVEGSLIEDKLSERMMPAVRQAVFEPLGHVLIDMCAQSSASVV